MIRWGWVTAIICGVLLALAFCMYTGVMGETVFSPGRFLE
jgi:ABC-type Fe3+-siderophore transport system permease subunit